MKNSPQQILFSSVAQKIIYFLASQPDRQFSEKEIATASGSRKSAANLALRKLAVAGLVQSTKIGRSALHRVAAGHPAIKEMKIMQTILETIPLTDKLAEVSQKIVLFGSSAKGENRSDSDIDIFVLANDVAKVRKIINTSPLADRVQAIINRPAEMLAINRNKPLLYQEIDNGITLWEI